MGDSVLAVISAVVKGIHVYRNKRAKVSVKLVCSREPDNRASRYAVAVKHEPSDTMVGHVPEQLARILFGLLDRKLVTTLLAKVTRDPRTSAGGMWKKGGGVELPCKYILYGKKQHKEQVRVALKHAEKLRVRK
jgi:hypothetical protein